jgi:histidinol-phosphate aminotransferase
MLDKLPDYVAGKPIEELARERNLSRIIKLASNENPIGPSLHALAAYHKAARNLRLYPDNNCYDLMRLVSKIYGVEESMLLFGTGSDDAMHLATWAFGKPGSAALLPCPGFLGYRIFAESFGLAAVNVDLPGDFWNADAFIWAGEHSDASIVYLASPNNPTGTGLIHEDVDRISGTLPDATIILDLAYEEFDADENAPRFVELIAKHPNLIACKTFSKAYGLAGLRLGYAVARPDRIADMKKLRTQFAANGPALESAVAALLDEPHLRKSVKLARDGVAWWTEKLKELGFVVTPSRANFVMARLGREAKSVYEAMLTRGVIVRYLGAFGLTDALRITAGLPEENEYALAALRDALL